MKLRELLKAVPIYELRGDPEQEIEGLGYDSREIGPGYLFVALKGYQQNGHDYIPDAVKNGAISVVTETFEGAGSDVIAVKVPDSRETLWRLAAQFYGNPMRDVNIIAITGTNGKTTTSYLLESILATAGAKPGVIGTINHRYLGKAYPAEVTTPESLVLVQYLRKMVNVGVTDVIMEVSSHALDQKRTGDCPFKVGIFTNFSRDHLDYHQSMDAYFQAKSLLFRGLQKGEKGKGAWAVINSDDPKGEELTTLTQAEILTYGLGRESNVSADSISFNLT